jgi:hypothetical protein
MAQVSDKNGCYEYMRWCDSRYNAMIDSVAAEDRVNSEAFRLTAALWLEIGVHWDDGKLDDSWMPGMPPPPPVEEFDVTAAIEDLRSNWRKYVASSRRLSQRIDAEDPHKLNYTLFSELIDAKKAKPEDAELISDDFIDAAVEEMTVALGLDQEQEEERAINEGLPLPAESPVPPTPPLPRELPPQPQGPARPSGKAASVRPGQPVGGS